MYLSPTTLKLIFEKQNRIIMTFWKSFELFEGKIGKNVALIYSIKKVQQSGLMPIAMGSNLNWNSSSTLSTYGQNNYFFKMVLLTINVDYRLLMLGQH